MSVKVEVMWLKKRNVWVLSPHTVANVVQFEKLALFRVVFFWKLQRT